MNPYILYIIGVLFISSACGFVFIPATLRFCKKHRIYDHPSGRKIHKNAVPRLGGIVFMPSMLFSFAVALSMLEPIQNKVTLSLWTIYFLAALLLIYVTGIIDDIIGLKPLTKFLIQIAAACALPLGGLYLNDMYGFLGLHELPFWAGFPLTVLVIAFIDNALNLIDGIDGLAACLSIIALSGFCYMFAAEQVWAYSILTAGLIGVLLSFLHFNLFGKCANGTKIFMGDSGSLTLGFILGALCVKYFMRNPAVISHRETNVFMAFTLLILPMLDTVRVFAVRLWHGCSPFNADKRHIHHKLMAAGLTQHKTLLCIVCLDFFYIILNLLLLEKTSSTTALLVDTALFAAFNAAVNIAVKKNSELA